ncbi:MULTISPECIES: serine hydrolase domain-containing protein [unclassified Microbacterium]|uniref:serine hydrolase domain-containing protein n=1 Tax=unclassified Microbacterium TaxID=2609290 RepID=UPI00214B9DEA|nr:MULTISPECIES: serine hydrolase domain-containing protein [unclassified Microbacterium]MCR2783644.1 beta-lactamase family protein [Microbacterium sp. zg.B96]WIM15498.1 serine hydrolase domain-containing protein [Microbacterium sp. zg-B96]
MSAPYSHAFEWARRQVDSGALPTAVLGVATASGIQALDAFGATGARPAQVDDHYRLFSITKPLVGLAAARMIEAGLATPETPLQEDVPAFARNRDDVVRLRHLASHTSGIAEPPMDDAAGLEAGLLGPRDFAAGSASRYSTIAFEGIARMIQARTSRTWDAAVADALDPVGATGLTLDEASNPHEVVDGVENGLDLPRFAALRHPGAGLLGRAEDLLQIGSALLRDAGEIVRPATLAMMRRPLTGDIPRLDPYPASRGQDWGFTWNLRTRAPGLIDQDVYGHGGWAGTEFWVHPTAGVAYVLLTNRVDRPGVDADQLDNAVVSGV